MPLRSREGLGRLLKQNRTADGIRDGRCRSAWSACRVRARSTQIYPSHCVRACVRACVRLPGAFAPILGVSRLTTAALVASIFAMLSDGLPTVVVADEAFAASLDSAPPSADDPATQFVATQYSMLQHATTHHAVRRCKHSIAFTGQRLAFGR